ncbi:MAG: 16S rRNA (cytosine(1402)-N(4))-methyltransferase RsmH [Rhodospirillales bacterium]|nr:16S rRNA (cytosine(1402)-N(4))-methyltransferase RsmH [Rhodospirillales bacterium]
MSQKHIPVMLNEVLQSLAPADGKVYVDATFGNGGYTKAILDSANCKVIAIDRDPNVKERAKEIKAAYGERFEFCAGCFGDINSLVKQPVDGIVFDIGVSSMQLDQAERGFSYAKEANLDMRMSCDGVSAYDLINTASEKELADIIYQYGEERKSRQIASKIVNERKAAPIKTTKQLAEIIYQVIHKKTGQPDPATRTFQALRIAVNDELGELERGLCNGLSILKSGGKMVVVTFHSLEDRIVKKFFSEKSGKKVHVSRYAPEIPENQNCELTNPSKAILPTEEEIAANSRAHSAKLRYATKTSETNR